MTQRIKFSFPLKIIVVVSSLALWSCNDAQTKQASQPRAAKTEVVEKTENKTAEATEQSPDNAPVVGTVETSEFLLTLHRAIEFELAPKAYQPIKQKPGTKLVVLDISIKNKTSKPLDMGKRLIMSSIKDESGKKYLTQWVVGAYILDHPDAKHQAHYDAMWGNSFGPGEYHRSILMGMDPPKDAKNFKLLVHTSDDIADQTVKELKFSL